jgi:two-component system capsular synthesis sensor histidine kinase RcsC
MSASGRSSTAVRLLLEVCDSGVGISKPRQEKLFTPFYLADAERNISGAGLGLSICAPGRVNEHRYSAQKRSHDGQ